MYSVVLLMALSGGAEAPDCHRNSCHGCSGGCTGYVSTCGGCSGGGCWGSSCHGGGHGCHGGGGLFHRGHRGHGCHGGCSGSCSGYYSCSGYGGCYGGCYGGACYGGACYGGACTGGYPGCAGGGMMMAPGGPAGEKIKEMPKEKEKGKEEVLAPATIVLSLPADAQVTLDGVVTTSTSASRTFVTPDLTPGTEFVYTLSAKIVRDGETRSVTQKVSVRAGEESRVNLGTEQFTAATVAAK
jgi:uncharacterized protein (TIGR03000 family)